MPDEPEVTTENLRQLTNEAEGFVEEPGSQESATNQAESAAAVSAVAPTLPAPTGQASFDLSDDERGLLTELRALKEISGTPFKTPADLVKSYKSAVGELTKRTQEVKPYEQLIKLARENPQFATFASQAAQVFQNPSLLSAYMNPQGQTLSGTPDPRQYDLSTFEGLEKWQTDTLGYARRMAQEDVRTQLAQIEHQNRINEQRRDFKGKYKDTDPDEIQTWLMQEGPNLNPLEVAHRYRNYENLEAQMLEKARKELNEQVKTASKTKTPAAPAPTDSTAVNAEEVLEYLVKHTSEAAFKKFGQAVVVEVLKTNTF